MPKITPFLWFDGRAEEAMSFYTSVFKNSKVGRVSRAASRNLINRQFLRDSLRPNCLDPDP